MEVHAHTHSPRKKWTHYFWEFLMLFLAVFCGFLAEYMLEHKIEKNRERQYIRSFLEDLSSDTIDLKRRISYCERTILNADSLITILNSDLKNERGGDIYYFLRLMHRSDLFSVNDRTIIQLRNAGGMRLVTNKTVSDSMLSYYKEIDFIRFIYEEQTEFRRALRPHFPKFLDGMNWGMVIDQENRVVRTNKPLLLRSEDPDVINAIILLLQNIKGINLGIKKRLNDLIVKGNNIRIYIQNEYGLSKRTTLEK